MTMNKQNAVQLRLLPCQPRLAMPPCGWTQGLQQLVMLGRCPWCGYPIQNISVDLHHGVTWACFEGCNP